MAGLAPGYYLARVYGSKANRPQFPWVVRQYDGWYWWDLGREGSRTFPSCSGTHSGLIRLDEPTEPGRYLTIWEDRKPGFYWFWWRPSATQIGYWDITEFKASKEVDHNGHWIWIDDDEALMDNDLSDHLLVGPIQLPAA